MHKVDRKQFYLYLCQNIKNLKETLADLRAMEGNQRKGADCELLTNIGTWHTCYNLSLENCQVLLNLHQKEIDKYINELKTSMKSEEREMRKTEKKLTDDLKKNN